MNRMAILHNLTLDCLYRMHCEKCDNVAMRRELEKKHLPPLTDEQIAMFRQQFQERELKFPEQMRRFRDRLGIK